MVPGVRLSFGRGGRRGRVCGDDVTDSGPVSTIQHLVSLSWLGSERALGIRDHLDLTLSYNYLHLLCGTRLLRRVSDAHRPGVTCEKHVETGEVGTVPGQDEGVVMVDGRTRSCDNTILVLRARGRVRKN